MAKLWVLSHFKKFQQLCLCASQQAQFVWYCGFQAVGATVCVRNEFSMLTKQEPAVAWQLPLLKSVSEPRKLPHEGVVHRPRVPWVDAHYPAVGVTHLKVREISTCNHLNPQVVDCTYGSQSSRNSRTFQVILSDTCMSTHLPGCKVQPPSNEIFFYFILLARFNSQALFLGEASHGSHAT